MISIFEDKKRRDMYRLRWPDGQVTSDYYSLTRALENATRVAHKQAQEMESTKKTLKEVLEQEDWKQGKLILH